jgi:chromosome segregation ATPase
MSIEESRKRRAAARAKAQPATQDEQPQPRATTPPLTSDLAALQDEIRAARADLTAISKELEQARAERQEHRRELDAIRAAVDILAHAAQAQAIERAAGQEDEDDAGEEGGQPSASNPYTPSGHRMRGEPAPIVLGGKESRHQSRAQSRQQEVKS